MNYDDVLVGIIIVDYGLRRVESNEFLNEVVVNYCWGGGFDIVEFVYMEFVCFMIVEVFE